MNRILQAIQSFAQQKPEQVAFIGEGYTGQELTLKYAELDVRIHMATEVLKELGARCIALKTENCLEWVIADLAAMLAGIAMVPVPTFFFCGAGTACTDRVGSGCLNRRLAGLWRGDYTP
jgi:long-subunit acyl-CoA synthetase (AMP-forming)